MIPSQARVSSTQFFCKATRLISYSRWGMGLRVSAHSPLNTHRNQSTAMMSVMSSVGRPTDVSTMTMVTRPA